MITCACSASRVYPRACGATRLDCLCDRRCHGLSPRVRGNRELGRRRGHRLGSIPARAGQPGGWTAWGTRSRVYPRACGATSVRNCRPSAEWGLSPRVRGNHIRSRSHRRNLGSIPARAGQPIGAAIGLNGSEVYPRACGATLQAAGLAPPIGGLSPRVRGNRRRAGKSPDVGGSIPARAGQPQCLARRTPPSAVYPRACGATLHGAHGLGLGGGLSPRVRGNQTLPLVSAFNRRSIPARAGQPSLDLAMSPGMWVYPRACGATRWRSSMATRRRGLSPRVRGNRFTLFRPLGLTGSIPARAGQPGGWTPWSTRSRVYPRACGATRHRGAPGIPARGLSPRVRGNRRHQGIRGRVCGSIPARAGQPPR